MVPPQQMCAIICGNVYMAVSAGPWMEKDLEMNRGAAKGRKRGKLFLLPALDIAKCHQPRSYGIDKILHECFAKRRQIVFMWPPDPLSGSREGGFFSQQLIHRNRDCIEARSPDDSLADCAYATLPSASLQWSRVDYARRRGLENPL